MNQTQGNSKEVGTPRYLSLVVPLRKVGDEAVHKELGDRMERVATTASSSEAEQDSSGPRCQDTILGDVDAQTRFETTSEQSNDPPQKLTHLEVGRTFKLTAVSLRLILVIQLNAAKHKVSTAVQVPATEGDSINTSIKGFTYFFIRFHSFKPSLSISPNSISSLIIKISIMSSPKFAETHNVVPFLEKPAESDGFAEIIDFLKASSVKMVNGVRQLQALIDKKMVIITEASIRKDLHLDDAECTDCLPNTTIFEELAKMRTEEVGEIQFSNWIPNLEEEEHFNTPSNDPLPSVKAKSNQAIKIASLKKRVDKLEKRRQLRTTGLTRFKKLGTARRVKSSNAGLGAQEDASKQGRSIEDIDADAEVTLVNEQQNEDLMFDTGVLDDDEVFVDVASSEKNEQSTKLDDSTAGEAVTTASVEDSVAPTIQVSTADIGDSAAPTIQVSTAGIGEVTTAKIDELTLAQTLIEIKAAKPKVVTTAATTTTTTRPKGKGVVVQEPSEFRVPQESQPSISKDKGKGIMVEPEVPLKRKDQIALDEQIARDIQAKLDAELEEEQKLARKQEEEANIALIESWENTQAMMEADRLMAERLQSKEREELTDEEKGKLFMELMEKRRKHFAALRAQEKRNRPPTKAQKRTQMSTYLKHMGKQQQQESLKKQKMEEDNESDEVEEVSEDDKEELLKHLVIKKDEDIIINAIPLATKLPVLVDYKLHKEGMLVHYQLIRADGSFKRYSSMIRMLQGIDREDLDVLWRIVKAKHNDTRPEDEFERVLWGYLKVMFEPDTTSDVWGMLQGYRVTIWKLIDSSGGHFVRKVNERFECIPPEYDEEFVLKKLEDSEAEHQFWIYPKLLTLQQAKEDKIGFRDHQTYTLSPRRPVCEAFLKKKITRKEDIGGNFEIPCNIGGLKRMNTLVDQGSDVNVMPLSTYIKLTDERPAETNIRLSLASHSYIYPLGIADDVLVDVAGFVYPLDFVILDIKEDEKRPFILGTPFLTMAKAIIKFDKGTITLRSRKSKISFHRIPESRCKVEKGIKNNIRPIAPTMTVNRLVLE
ncbi:zf-CCHC domain-containing protein [Tanacetum coccineum]